MAVKDIFKEDLKFKAQFDLKKFYEDLKRFLEELEWEGKFGKDYYETYYYHKVTPQQQLFAEIKWELNKVFWKEEPKVSWYLEITMIVNGYSLVNKTGEISITIKTSLEIEEFKEPEPKNFFEKFLVKIGLSPSFLKKNLEKRRDVSKLASRELFKESSEIRDWILEYFKGYK